MKDDTIASAARRWDAARLLSIKLRAERSSFLCDRDREAMEHEAAIIDHNLPSLRSVATVRPCWKTFVGHGQGENYDEERLPENEWCPKCQERQAVYLALRAANRERGVALRQMQALLAAERKRLGFNEDYTRKSLPRPLKEPA